METAGIDRIITVDLHQGQIQGFFDIPVNHLTALPIFADYFKSKDFPKDNVVVVSPDMGRAKAAKKFADLMDADVAIMHKGRPSHNKAEIQAIIGDVEGKICIINDDMIDTAGTLVGSMNELKRQGAGDIYVCATHGIFSGPAITRLQEAPIEECVVTDAIPCFMADRPGSKIKTISVADELAEAIHHVYVNEPTTDIFGGDLNL
jgi:ribose-phosphate pyrophosphokinase